LKKAQENESQRAAYESKINNLEETIKQLSQVKLEQESEILRLELVARRVKDLEDQLRTAN
jgi:tRNA threonylcarbamoyladenosine modification (KEOPS) complex  Pcc1 subunit